MYIITPDNPLAVVNLGEAAYLEVRDKSLVLLSPVNRTLDNDNGEERLHDIVQAIDAELKFYDCNLEIGKWKKPERKKPGPKPKAKEEPKVEPKAE